MTHDRLALLERLAAEETALAEELLAGVACPDVADLVEADLCLSIPCPSPSEEGARAFVQAVLGWLREDDLRPVAEWLREGERSGMASFVCTLHQALPRRAAVFDLTVEGLPAEQWLSDRLASLAALLSAVSDVHLTRGHQCVGLVASYLEAFHRLGSPLSVVTMQVDLAASAVESGDYGSVLRHLQEALDACDTVIRMRRDVGDDTPVWAHALRHLQPPQGESLA